MLLKYKRKNISIDVHLVKNIFNKNNLYLKGKIIKSSDRVFFVDNKVIKFSDPRFPSSHLWSEIYGYKIASMLGFKVPKIFLVGCSIYKRRKLMWFIAEKIKGNILEPNKKNVSLVFELIKNCTNINQTNLVL